MLTRRVLYTLKRQWGKPVVYHRRDTTVDPVPDPLTGDIVSPYTSWNSKAIILPTDEARKFFQDLAFIAHNREFTYGGDADQSLRRMIFDVADLPYGFRPEQNDYVVYNGERYDVHESSDFEGIGFVVTFKLLKDAKPNVAKPVQVVTTLYLVSDAEQS